MGFDWSKVKTVEVTPVHLRESTTEPYAIVTLSEAAKAATILSSAAQMFVWIWIVHQTKKRNSKIVTVSNSVLAPYGLSRKVKDAALDQLEAAVGSRSSVNWVKRRL